MAKFKMPGFIRQTFNGVKYCIDFRPFDAICDNPKLTGPPEISFPKGFKPTRYGLELLLHESLHACDFSVSEPIVEQTAKDISKLLWKLYKPRIQK